MESQLARLCVESACESRDSVEKWRRQKRSLERLPSHLADALLRRLVSRRILFPSLLEVFKESAEEVDLRGHSSVDAEWMAYIGAFRHLRSLNVADCHRLTSSALWAIAGMRSLKELDLSRCLKVNDAGIGHVVSISTLERLFVSETGISANGVKLLSSLKNLIVLDLGGLPVTDQALSSLQVLTKLQHLDVWGSKISDKGAHVFQVLPNLSFLNLAWTNIGKFPNLPSLQCLNMSNCIIKSVLELDGDKAPLSKLDISGATLLDDSEAFMHIDTSFMSHLNLSNSPLRSFCFLPHMKVLEHLDLSSTMMGDDAIEEIVCIGANLRYLDLSKNKISSVGVGILAGHVPNLEILSLSETSVDDVAISYISLMPSLKEIDLSKTNIKGIVHEVGLETEPVPSLQALKSLRDLQKLNLEQTKVMDAALDSVSSFQELTHVSLRNASLTDISLSYMSSLPKLTNLSIHDAVLTNQGLGSFHPPETLKTMDLRGCWLLTEDDILSFCRSHCKVEVVHEHVHVLPSDQGCPSRSPPSRSPLKKTQLSPEDTKTPLSPFFVDQRLKYSREELLGMQHLSFPATAQPHMENILTPKSDSNS